MKPIGIVTDSHSGIAPEDAQQMGIYVLPMPFYVDEECFYEGIWKQSTANIIIRERFICWQPPVRRKR